MQRETIEVTTAGGVKAVLNAYITGGEKRKIAEYYLNAQEGATSAQRVLGAEDLTLNLVVVSLNESAEDILGRLLALPSADMDEITEKVKEIIEPKKK